MEREHHLIPLKVHGVLVDPNTDTQIVVLRDDGNTEVLPIWVGTAEGTSIRLALEGIVPPRPMSHDLITSFAQHLGFTVTKVIITEVKENTYYAVLHLTANGIERVIDCRPSDAIAVAVRTKSPIYVTAEVLERKSSEHLDAWLAKLDLKHSDQSES
ncbi:MAG: bifunctional nuclease family protein [Nitrospirae bacterium]|nr:MAG: bifunctional nuclease family protein [Nitrospirota bacterium]